MTGTSNKIGGYSHWKLGNATTNIKNMVDGTYWPAWTTLSVDHSLAKKTYRPRETTTFLLVIHWQLTLGFGVPGANVTMKPTASCPGRYHSWWKTDHFFKGFVDLDPSELIGLRFWQHIFSAVAVFLLPMNHERNRGQRLNVTISCSQTNKPLVHLSPMAWHVMMFLFSWGHAIPRMIENSFVLLIANKFKWTKVKLFNSSASLATIPFAQNRQWPTGWALANFSIRLRAAFHLLSTTGIRCFWNRRITSHPFHASPNLITMANHDHEYVYKYKSLLSIKIMITSKFPSTIKTPRKP